MKFLITGFISIILILNPIFNKNAYSQTNDFLIDYSVNIENSNFFAQNSIDDNISNISPNTWLYGFLIPGLPQIMMGEKQKGGLYLGNFVAWLIVSLPILILSINSFVTGSYVGDGHGFILPGLFAIAGLFVASIHTIVFIVFYILGIIDAYKLNQELLNNQESFINNNGTIVLYNF